MTSPIIETNIERILEDNLWEEIELIEARIYTLNCEVDVLKLRALKLQRIAEAAEIKRPELYQS
jgi:hypothetical protein